MNLHTSSPYWLLKNGLPQEYASLKEHLTTDIVVMGGGISGALVTWYLAKAGIPVCLVDRRHIGTGSTCASTALLQYEIDTPLHKLKDLVGKKNAVRSYQLCIEAIDKLEKIAEKMPSNVHFERKPSFYYASKKNDVQAIESEFAIRRKHGIRVEQWSQAQIREAFNFKSPAALYSPHDGAQVDAYAFTYALIQEAVKLGASVFDKTEITQIKHEPRSVELRTGSGQVIKTKKLVIAAGYESQQYLEQKVTRLHSTYVVVSEPYEMDMLWHENALIWETARPYLYLRTISNNRVMAGGKDEPFYSPGKRDRLLARKTRELIKAIEQKFPHLVPVRLDFNWAGTFAETADGLPYIGTVPEHPNTWFALGFGGNGITFSLIAAEIILDAISGKKNPDASIFSFLRTK